MNEFWVAGRILLMILAVGSATLSAEEPVEPPAPEIWTQQYKASSFGGFQFGYPLDLPPGSGGLAPRLELVYGSNSPNGWFGKGISLSGLSVIERDGSFGNLVEDRFLLDGQKLQFDDTARQFRTEVENFERIQAYTAAGGSSLDGGSAGTLSCYWVRSTKDGTKFYYGYKTSNRVPAIGRTGSRCWPLDRVEDSRGNYYEINYSIDGTNGDYYPREILYSKSLNGTSDPIIGVYFGTEVRSDHAKEFGFSPVDLDQRVTSIEVWMKPASNGTGSVLLRTWTMGYRYGSTGLSQLTSVTVKEASEKLGRTTSLAWQDGANRPQFSAGSTPKRTADAHMRTLYGDANGDGRDDVISFDYELVSGNSTPFVSTFLSTSTGVSFDNKRSQSVSEFPQDCLTADVNGDGRVDIVGYRFTGTYLETFNYVVSLADADGKFGNFSPSVAISIPRRNPNVTASDVNGDGCADLLLTSFIYDSRYSGGGSSTVLVSNRNNSFTVESGPYFPAMSLFSYNDNFQLLTGDLDEDGLEDLVFLGRDGYHAFRSLKWGTDVGPDAKVADSGWGSIALSNRTACLGDVNGDGHLDMVTAGFGTSSLNWTVRLGDGKGGFQSAKDGSFPLGSTPDWAASWFLGDVDGDHLDDIVVYTFASQRVSIQVGRGTREGSLTPQFGVVGSGAFPTFDIGLWGFVGHGIDANGDGMKDLVGAYNFTSTPKGHQLFQYLAVGSQPDLVVQVTQPDGGSISVGYAPGTSFSGIVNPSSSSYPNLATPRRGPLVNSITYGDGPGAQSPDQTTTYSYQNSRRIAGTPRDQRDLGFGQVTVTSAASITKTSYYQDSLRRGQVSRVETLTPGGALVAGTAYEMEISGSRVLLKRKTEIPYEGTSTIVKQKFTDYTYDDYGNLLSTTEKGWADGTGADLDVTDDLRVSTEWNVNTAAWIMKPKRITTSQANAEGVVESTSIRSFYYDGSNGLHNNSLDKGLVTKREDAVSGTVSTVTRFAYDSWGNQIKTWDGRYNGGEYDSLADDKPEMTTSTEYDSNYHSMVVGQSRYLPSGVASDGKDTVLTSSTQYDSLLRPSVITDPNGKSTKILYDAFGRVKSTTVSNDSSLTTTTMNSDVEDANAFPRYVKTSVLTKGVEYLDTYTYSDGLGRTIQTKREDSVAGQWITQDWSYDSSGRNDKISVPRITTTPAYSPVTNSDWVSMAKTTYVYDPLGRVIQITNPDGTTKKTFYQPNVVWTLDENFHLTSVEDDINKVITRTYESEFQVFPPTTLPTKVYSTITKEKFAGKTKTTDSADSVTTETFDMLGRRTKLETPDTVAGKSWEYTYDANGNLKTQSHPNGKDTTFVYDALDRLTDKTYSDSTPPVHYTYDLNDFGKGRLSSVTFGRGSDSYRYDIRGRVTIQTRKLDGLSRTLRSTYDSMDRKASETLPTGEKLVYDYGLDGNLKTLTGQTGYLTDAKYDPKGLVTRMNSTGGISRYYNYYDTSGETDTGWVGSLSQRLRSQAFRVNDVTLVGLSYHYDRKGNLTGKTDTLTPDNTQSYEYKYDSLDRLTSFESDLFGSKKTWTYSETNNINTFAEFTFDYVDGRPHVLSSAEGLAYSATINGSQSSITDGTGFVYDAESRLVSTTDARGEAITYSYDAMRQRTVMEAGPRKTYYWFPNYEETYRGQADTDAAIVRDYPDNPAGRQFLTDAWSSGFTTTNLTTSVNSGVVTAQRTSTANPGYFSWATSFSADKVKVVQIRARGVAGETLRVKVNSTFYLPSAILTPEWQTFTFDTSIPEWTGTITSLLAVLHMNGAAELDWVYVGDGITLPSTLGQAINASSGAVYKQDDWNSTDNWVANDSMGTQGNLTARNGYLTITSNNKDTWINKNDLNFSGAENRYISLRVRQTSGSTGRRFNVYYATDSHSFTDVYRVQAKVPNTALNQWVTINLNMSNINYGGDDWIKSTIQALRFDFGEAEGESFDIDWIYVGNGTSPTEYPNNWLKRVYLQGSWNGVSGWTSSSLTATTANGVVTLQRSRGQTGFFTKVIDIDADVNKVIQFKARATDGANKIRFKQATPTNATVGGAQTLTGDWQIFTVDTSSTSQWSGSVASVQFALDMDGPVEIDWVYIGTGSRLAGDYPNDPVGTYYANHTWETTDGWSSSAGQSVQVTTEGSLTVQAQSPNRYPTVQRDTAISATTTKNVAVKWRADVPIGQVSLYFNPSTPGVVMDETTKKTLTSTATSGIATFDMATAAKWKDTITTIRLDFGNSANPVGKVWIDWIYIGNGDSLPTLDTWISTYQANGVTLAERSPDGLKYLVQDHLGSVVATADENGLILSTIHYAPFGSMLEAPQTSDQTTYTGQKWDSDSGLYYYNARYYNPRLGRFIQPDPALWDGQYYGKVPLTLEEMTNPYLYAMNNPVRYTDPTGLIVLRGANGVVYNTSATGSGVVPLSGEYKVSGDYGKSPGNIGRGPAADLHAGVDFTSSARAVQASKDGTVIFAGVGPAGDKIGTGVMAVVENTDGTTSLYGHLDPKSIGVQAGQRMSAGEDFAQYANPTVGTSTGPHLHYEEYQGVNVDRSGSAVATSLYGTGYYYDQSSIPDSSSAINSAKESVTVRDPRGQWEEQ